MFSEQEGNVLGNISLPRQTELEERERPGTKERRKIQDREEERREKKGEAADSVLLWQSLSLFLISFFKMPSKQERKLIPSPLIIGAPNRPSWNCSSPPLFSACRENVSTERFFADLMICSIHAHRGSS